MSNNTVLNSYIAKLNSISNNITCYGYFLILITGNIGFLLNILILTQRNYRQRSCSCYILASTLSSVVLINIASILRILSTFGIDPISTSIIICKLRIYIVQATAALSRFFLTIACIDRWAMTSTTVQRRAFAQMKFPKILIPSISIVWCLSTIHVLIYQDIINGRCIMTPNLYLMFYNIYSTIYSGILIPLFMIIFGLLTIRNVHQLQKRVRRQRQVSNVTLIMEQNADQQITNKKNHDYQLLFMVLVQICVYIITTLPFASYLFYIALTANWPKSSLQTAIDNFYMNVVYLILYFDFSSTFYIYILTSHIFRKDLKNLLVHNRFMERIFGNLHNPPVRPLIENPVPMLTL